MSLKLVAYTSDVTPDGRVILTNSEEDSVISDNPYELLAFLGENFSDDQYREMKVAFDLDTFIAPILKRLGVDVCRELAGASHSCDNIFYIPSKVLVISTNGHKSYVYHIAQYFEDEPDPHDPLEIHAKASILLDAFRSMGLEPYKLTSPVAVYEAEVLNHMSIPTILDLPESRILGQDVDELINWAEQCVGKLWIENFAVGRWNADEIWSYDIQASFPSIAAQLPSIKYAKLAKSHFFAPDADWGFLKGEVTINPDRSK